MKQALFDFFETNMTVVLFAYGLSFFAMGLAVALQSRRPSELRMARRLPLLGTFGILHALASWGLVFIPIQRTYTPPAVVIALEALYALLTAFTFTFLLSFGAHLLADTHARLWPIRYLPALLTTVWTVSFFVYPLTLGPRQYSQWLVVSDTWARYILGVPGAVLAALALGQQFEEFHRLGMQRLVRQLEWAIFSFVGYAVTGGLVVPRTGFFPARFLNAESFFQATGIPIELLRAVSGLGIAYFMIRVMEMFDIEAARRMEEVQRMRAVLTERDRIARELHDGVIQSLYALGLGLENAAFLVADQPDRARQTVEELMGRVNDIIHEVRGYIMDLRLPGETALPLSEKLRAVASEASRVYHVPITMDVRGVDEARLGSGVANELSLMVKEAVSNAARHGKPSAIRVGVHAEGNELVLYVQDDGRGFDVAAAARAGGFGLSNMRKRAALLGGELDIDSRPGEGTTVMLRMPLAPAGGEPPPGQVERRAGPARRHAGGSEEEATRALPLIRRIGA